MAAQGDYIVTAVTEDISGSGTELWRVRFRQAATGAEREHIFPKFTLDARAAEYGIDPNDVDALLDVIFHEPYVPDPTQPRNFADDAAAKIGHTVQAAHTIGPVRKGQDVPAWLFNAATIAQARAAHLARIAHCKATRMRIVPAAEAGLKKNDPLDVIRAAHSPDHELISALAAEVDHTRRQLRAQPPPEPQRALRRQMIRNGARP